jgi:hypothetical protein
LHQLACLCMRARSGNLAQTFFEDFNRNSRDAG